MFLGIFSTQSKYSHLTHSRSSFDISINRRSAQTVKYTSKCFPDNFPSFNGRASTWVPYFRSRIVSPLALEHRLNFNFGGSSALGRWITLVVNEVERRHVARGNARSLNHFQNLPLNCTANYAIIVKLEQQRTNERWNASLWPMLSRTFFIISRVFFFSFSLFLFLSPSLPFSLFQQLQCEKFAWIFI